MSTPSSKWRKLWLKLKKEVRPNYFRLHWLYIVLISLVGALVIFAIEGNLHYVDAFFVSASCASGTGLTTVDITEWHWESQAVAMV